MIDQSEISKVMIDRHSIWGSRWDVERIFIYRVMEALAHLALLAVLTILVIESIESAESRAPIRCKIGEFLCAPIYAYLYLLQVSIGVRYARE